MAQNAPSSFNEIHKDFVTTEDGTTLAELLQVLGCISLAPFLVSVLLPWVVPSSFVQHAVSNQEFFFLIRGILEYPVIIVLPIWIVTVFAGAETVSTNYIHTSGVVLLTLLCVPIGILIVNHAITAPKWLGIVQHWSKLKTMPTGWGEVKVTEKKEGEEEAEDTTSPTQSKRKLPFVTSYRAIVIQITVLCILAIDFVIFPRRFAKTKDYGISLMDVGTGCFVFANGIVAPEARNRRSPLLKSMISTIPIILLGFVRLATVKGIEYQEVVEEYGVHWNFFFTLAGVKVFSSLFFRLFDSSHGLKLAALVSLLYELLLQHDDYQNAFILNPRVSRSESLLHANREGIYSVFGYLSIYMASVYFGKLIYWKERVTVREWTEYACQTFLQIMILWACYAAAIGYGILPCRRTANVGYVLLMTSLNYSLLWGQMFLSLVQVCLQHHGIIYGPIIFYELKALHQNSAKRIQKLQKMSKEFSKVNRKDRDDFVDEQMQDLEDQLTNACEEMKNLKSANCDSYREVAKKIDAIENEIKQLEKRLMDTMSDAEVEQDSEPQKENLVLLPDLSKCPVLLEAICYNGLAVFLLGNVLTGLINCLIYTMYTPVYLSLCYLWFYSTVISGFSITLYWFQIQLKCW